MQGDLVDELHERRVRLENALEVQKKLEEASQAYHAHVKSIREFIAKETPMLMQTFEPVSLDDAQVSRLDVDSF